MFNVRFFSSDRRAEPPLPQEGLREALEVMLAFKGIAPAIVVEQDGTVLAESRGGDLVTPRLDGALKSALEREHPPEISYHQAQDLLRAYRLSAAQLDRAGPLDWPLACTRLLALEATVLAHAARDGLDLADQGFTSAQVLIERRNGAEPTKSQRAV